MRRLCLNKKRILAILVACLLPFAMTPTPAAAETASATGSITLHYEVANAQFQLYQVKSIGADGSESYCGNFAQYNVDLTKTTAAETLSGYVLRDADSFDPVSATTDTDGNLTFSGLSKGYYLILGQKMKVDSVTYTPSPMLVAVPQTIDDKQTMTVSADAKYSKEPETGIVTSTSKKVTVNKVWENDEESDRPTEISVQLLCDGTVYDTVTLSADNSWTYTWPLLDNTKSWTVVEESVPDGYSVSLTNTEDSYTLTNTGDSDFKSSSKVKTSPPTGKIKTDHSPKSTKTKGSPGSRLPKTGQLWWPITILAAAGMILILVGLIRRKRSL